jgi:hypothetical protein
MLPRRCHRPGSPRLNSQPLMASKAPLAQAGVLAENFRREFVAVKRWYRLSIPVPLCLVGRIA